MPLAGADTIDDSILEVIDLDRYPIASIASDTECAFVEKCRKSLRETGVCYLPGFVKSGVAAAMATEGLALLPASYRDESRHNVYFTGEDPDLPGDHPGYHSQRLATNTIPYDLIAPDSMLRRLYNWVPLLEFVAAVLGRKRLYLHADPMGAMILFVHGEGDELGWHFDHADFVTTLVLQAPERGGAFEYVQNLREPDDENHVGVRQVLSGADESVVRLPAEAGALSLFVGQHSIHRVTPTKGPRPRVVAVLSYVEEPGVKFTDEERIRFYGRAGRLT